MTDLKTLQQKVLEFRDKRNWRQYHNPKDSAISLVLEVAELIEHFQWKSETDIQAYLKDSNNKEALSDELIDVLYWLLVMAHDFDIDLNAAFEQKMQKNEEKYPLKNE